MGGGGERYHGIQGRDSEGTSAPRRKNVPASKPLPACTLDTALRNPMPHVSKRIVALPKKIDRCQKSYTEPLFREEGLSFCQNGSLY